jgi:HAD superfamily hydrolase (TIGR01490 family)
LNLTLFDLDGTLLPIDSDHSFGDFLVALGWVDGDAFRRRNDGFYRDYQAGCLDLDAYIDFATAPWRDRPADELAVLSARFVTEVVVPQLRPSATALVRAHQRAGDAVAIVTATNEFVTRPIADGFGVADLIAVELERNAAGNVSGRIRGVPSFRGGKNLRVDQWLAARGQCWSDFERTTVYSDYTNDQPLLERAGVPVATNPGPALDALARERGWRILRLFA